MSFAAFRPSYTIALIYRLGGTIWTYIPLTRRFKYIKNAVRVYGFPAIHPLLTASIDHPVIMRDLLDHFMEFSDILKIAVHRCKADVCDLVELLQLTHH